MRKIALTAQGYFDLSDKAKKWLKEKFQYDYQKEVEKVKTEKDLCNFRSNPCLIKCIETLGSSAHKYKQFQLKIVEIPEDVKFTIEEHFYCDYEWIEEVHRTWGK